MTDSSLYQSVPVLDHGYVRFIESWGSDERIIESARMSTNKGFQGWGYSETYECKNTSCPGYSYSGPDCPLTICPNCSLDLTRTSKRDGDEKLLAYLYNHKHATPFEMAGLIIEVQAPIFVFREWHRHRTQSYNEMSARYTPLPDLNYIPTLDRLMQSGGSNKQAQGLKTLSEIDAETFRTIWLPNLYEGAENVYQQSLRMGVPKELARLVLPVARYSRMRASANLRNWLAFLTLRMDQNAQHEIRMYANQVGNIISQFFPRTWSLFIGENG